jgi:beta-lactamase superfamily II metal-dependent hydrolase
LEVCFADVGQGSCNVILLGERRAIVVDAGGRQVATVIRLLQYFYVESLVRLVVTHSHDDHSRGAAELLTAYSRRIEQVWFPHDDVLRRSVFWERVTEECERGNLHRTQLLRLERGQRPVTVYRQEGMYLDIIAPDFIQNLQAVEDRNANSTSGILLLGCGSRRVIFAGDSTIPEWQGLMERRKRPFKCDLLTVPHHAGGVWERQRAGEARPAFEARLRADLDWLYSSAVMTNYGIVSVGSNNQHKHPRPEVMGALLRAAVVPICTQMTRQCASDLEAQRGRSLPLVLPSRSVLRRDVNERSRSRNVPCAAMVLVELREEGVIIRRFADHQAMIDKLAAHHGGTPLCRPAAPPAPAATA